MTNPNQAATLTSSLVTVAQWYVDQLNANKQPLGIQAVFYGDQRRIAKTPTVCVEPAVKTNEFNESAMRRKIQPNFEVQIIVYHSLFDDNQVGRKQADLLGEAIEAMLNKVSNKDMQGTVIHQYVSRLESGYATKDNSVMRACRLTATGFSQVYLTS